ncbi:hypothetical protein CON64_10195 [Bacillus pseudomycoides]|nr:hypothetical protein CON64_10195 [Bacillus pseudomycoides]
MDITNFEISMESNFDEILTFFQTKIKKNLRHTPFQEREDLEQEIKLKIYEKMDILNRLSSPGFFDFLEEMEKKKFHYR